MNEPDASGNWELLAAAAGHCHRPVAAGILPAVAGGIPAARATKPNPRHDLASTSDHPAGSRAIRQQGMAATTAGVSGCAQIKTGRWNSLYSPRFWGILQILNFSESGQIYGKIDG
jgi:hypothetical protein